MSDSRFPILLSVRIAAVFLIVLVVSAPVFAQENTTPSPAPSKTPTPQSEIDSEGEDELPEQNGMSSVPWNQSDLSILTGNVQRPNGIVWFNNQLYVSCTGDSTIYELDAQTGATRTYIWGVRSAHVLHAERNEQGELNLWVPDFQANRLLRIDRNGVNPVSAELAGPWGITQLEDEFLITNLQANNVVAVSRAGEVREIFGGLRSPTGITTDAENIYVANTGSARRGIEWISKQEALNNADGTAETMPLVTGLQNTTGMVMGPDDYLYFAYSLGTRGVVGRVNPEQCRVDGGCTNDQVEIVVFTELAAPLAGLTIAPDMRLYVHTIFSPDIYWVQLERPDGESGVETAEAES